MKIIEWHIQGGIRYMLPLSILLIVLMIISVICIYRLKKKQHVPVWMTKGIRQIGLFSFFFGLLGQILGLSSGLGAIEAAGDISPGILAGGLKVSFYPTTYGLLILLIALVMNFWVIRLAGEK